MDGARRSIVASISARIAASYSAVSDTGFINAENPEREFSFNQNLRTPGIGRGSMPMFFPEIHSTV